ncbi:hypothetical protein ATKI12_0485 [Kitasatospora sp. Ki12]
MGAFRGRSEGVGVFRGGGGVGPRGRGSGHLTFPACFCQPRPRSCSGSKTSRTALNAENPHYAEKAPAGAGALLPFRGKH